MPKPTVLNRLAEKWRGFCHDYTRDVCPGCGQRALVMVNFIRATVIVDGKTAPDSWSCHVCESCGSRWRGRGREWEPIPEGEVN